MLAAQLVSYITGFKNSLKGVGYFIGAGCLSASDEWGYINAWGASVIYCINVSVIFYINAWGASVIYYINVSVIFYINAWGASVIYYINVIVILYIKSSDDRNIL